MGFSTIYNGMDDYKSNSNQSPYAPPQSNLNQPSGKGGNQVTFPGQGGQPRAGMPNQYSNTVGQWDNASIQPMRRSGGKGKGY